MGTRSIIKIKNGEGIYCHWDGYIVDGNGELLVRHFKKIQKIKKLINLGNISNLAEKIKTRKPHSYEKPVRDVTVAYHRDRGEDFDMVNFKGLNAKEYRETNTYYVDYIYEFDNGIWNVYCHEYPDGKKLTYKSLQEIRKEEENG